MIDWSNSTAGMPTDFSASIRVTEETRVGFIADISHRIDAGEGFAVATLNLDHIVKLRQDPAFRTAYRQHSHVTADGNPVVWLSRLAGRRVELLPGADLIDPVLAVAASRGVPVALLGTTDASLDAAAASIEARHPGLSVAARIAPAMGFDPTGPEADDCIRQLDASGAGLCLLALGAPKQEIFAIHARTALPAMGFVSIGAGLDFLSGAQRRAPAWVRHIAAEWIWRMLQNPVRLVGRYVACLNVLPGLVLAAWRARSGPQGT